MLGIINRFPVKSHTIVSMGYDVLTKRMEVEFRNGSVYSYFDVPEHIYKTALTRNSINTYLHKYVYGKYAQKKEK